jgi:hypothetical protein
MDMKTFRLRLQIFVLVAMLLNSCRKDEKIINEFNTYTAHVQKFSDKSPLINCTIAIGQRTWLTGGRNYEDTIIAFEKTDNIGNVKFRVKSNLILTNANVFYAIGVAIPPNHMTPDSTFDEWKYSGNCNLYHNGNSNTNPLIEVFPDCSITILSDVNDWKKLGMDSLIILNYPYENFVMHYDNGNGGYDVQFKAECSAINTITYYYYSNGIKSKEFTKQVYVPFGSRDGDIIKLNLTF